MLQPVFRFSSCDLKSTGANRCDSSGKRVSLSLTKILVEIHRRCSSSAAVGAIIPNFASQAEFFGRSHRIASVDLLGHGRSDAPRQNYTMAAFADDLELLCNELGLISRSWLAAAWAVI